MSGTGLTRWVKSNIVKSLAPGKVMILLGPRRVGKTVLLREIREEIGTRDMLLNGEDQDVHCLLSNRSIDHYRRIMSGIDLLLIDEAQAIPDIGMVLKLMVDHLPDLMIMVTGSSAFDLNQSLGEPLTGRKKTYHLYPLAEKEYAEKENAIERQSRLSHRLVMGHYPELLHIPHREDQLDYLKELVNSYLLKDILQYADIKHVDKIYDLLRLISFQLGGEVSYTEVAAQLSMSKNTVESYLDLLAKTFVLHSVQSYSGNLRKEIRKGKKWYFLDNGVRNMIIGDMRPLDMRQDVGALWENYVIAERLKKQSYDRMLVNNYFWRTYDQQEIDWLEERDGKLYAYKMKWSEPKKVRIPAAWRKHYEEASFEIVHQDRYVHWVDPKR